MLSSLSDDLRSLGICSGDTLLVRANLSKIARKKNIFEEFYDSLLSVIGDKGTIISLAFTNPKSPEQAFSSSSKSFAGSFPNRLLRINESFRSAHPTNSFVAVGYHSKYIVSGHDVNSPAFSPIGKLIQLNGKCLNVGCIPESPGFTTTHWAEYNLGLHKLLWGLRQIPYFIMTNAQRL